MTSAICSTILLFRRYFWSFVRNRWFGISIVFEAHLFLPLQFFTESIWLTIFLASFNRALACIRKLLKGLTLESSKRMRLKRVVMTTCRLTVQSERLLGGRVLYWTIAIRCLVQVAIACITARPTYLLSWELLHFLTLLIGDLTAVLSVLLLSLTWPWCCIENLTTSWGLFLDAQIGCQYHVFSGHGLQQV